MHKPSHFWDVGGSWSTWRKPTWLQEESANYAHCCNPDVTLSKVFPLSLASPLCTLYNLKLFLVLNLKLELCFPFHTCCLLLSVSTIFCLYSVLISDLHRSDREAQSMPLGPIHPMPTKVPHLSSSHLSTIIPFPIHVL